MSEHREFKEIGGANEEGAPGLSVDEFMAGLEALQAEVATEKNLVWERVADGTLSEELLKRLAKEYYFLGKWYTTEFGTLTSLAPDVDSLQLGSSQHFRFRVRVDSPIYPFSPGTSKRIVVHVR